MNTTLIYKFNEIQIKVPTRYLELDKLIPKFTWKNQLVRITRIGTSLVAQWLRIHLPIQGTRVRALVWEDPTYHRATKPVHHNY